MDAADWSKLVLLSVLWGSAFFLVEVALVAFSPLFIVAVRLAIAASILWVIVLAKGYPIPAAGPVWLMFLGIGLLNTVIPLLLISWGQTVITAGLAAILTAATPVIGVVVAGTSDLPVAREAALCAEVMGNEVKMWTDVGVAGLHRLLGVLDEIREAHIVVTVAGMEAALPSVLAGLLARPVVSIPTSVGYGASFDGLAALLSSLTACAPGVVTVNNDNGFGAAYAASHMNRD